MLSRSLQNTEHNLRVLNYVISLYNSKICSLVQGVPSYLLPLSRLDIIDSELQSACYAMLYSCMSPRHKLSQQSRTLQIYARTKNTGQLLLEMAIVVVQLLSVCMALGFIHSIIADPPHVEGGQNFHVYDHVSSGRARPLMPKKLEPSGAALAAALENATVVTSASDAALASDYPTCPETVSDDAIPVSYTHLTLPTTPYV